MKTIGDHVTLGWRGGKPGAVFTWTRLTTLCKCASNRRQYQTVYRLCLITMVIIVLLQFEGARYWTGGWMQTSRVTVTVQRTSNTNTSIEALNADLSRLMHRLAGIGGDTVAGNGSVRERTARVLHANGDMKAGGQAVKKLPVKDGAAKYGSAKYGAMKDGAAKGGAVKYDDVKGGAAKDGAVKDISVKDGAAKARSSHPLLVLFSSWEYSREKQSVHDKVLRLWTAWGRVTVRTLVYSSNATLLRPAALTDWQVRPITITNPACQGPPVLGALFTDAFANFRSFMYGYANADIVFGDGLVKTMNFIQNNNLWHSKPVLIVGRRHNYPFHKYTVPLNAPSDVKAITGLGKLVARSTDYFITNILFPWHHLPRVTIGRPFVVRAVIGYAIKHQIDVIDATNTIEAVHLTTSDGVFASWHTTGVFCNKRLLRDGDDHLPLSIGHCECARLETHLHADGHILLRSRDPDRHVCS